LTTSYNIVTDYVIIDYKLQHCHRLCNHWLQVTTLSVCRWYTDIKKVIYIYEIRKDLDGI
jgi:hypothetical protein